MPDQLTCFACEREPTQQCPRCGRPYCDEHGEELCDACLEPASGVPSFTLYRGSLLALPGRGGEAGNQPAVITATSTAGRQTPTATQAPNQTTMPAGTTTPGAARPGAPAA